MRGYITGLPGDSPALADAEVASEGIPSAAVPIPPVTALLLPHHRLAYGGAALVAGGRSWWRWVGGAQSGGPFSTAIQRIYMAALKLRSVPA